MMKRNYKDIVGGSLLAALGVYVLVTSFGFGIGTARRMGAGYYPMLLGVTTILLGVIIVAVGLRERGTKPRIAWKAFLATIAGLLAFYLLVGRAGLIPAVWGLVGISSLADDDIRPRTTLVLMLVVSLLTWLVFSVALDLPIPGFRGLG